ncbi:MAG: nitroreductase family protein [Thermoplasmata archaeon]|nr:nitroreductase family protein [Thermoplasmata archaeon]
MELLEIARRRKTIRKFKKDAPPLNDILYCIKVAKEAPSGMNSQPWRFLIVSNAKKKKEIRNICEEGEKKFYKRMDEKLANWVKERKITWEKKFLEDAPFLIIIFSDRNSPYYIQSTWLCIGYFLLALEEKGIASLTYTPPNADEIKKWLGLPSRYRLETIIPVGYSNEDKRKEKRKEIEEIAFFETL